MESSYLRMIAMGCSLLWPEVDLYKDWKDKATPSTSFYKDLSMNKVLDSLMFKENDRKQIGELFKNPCTSKEVLEYRLDIMQDFVENPWLVKDFKELVKNMVFIQNSFKKKISNPKGIHVQTCFFEQASKYVDLISGMRKCLDSGKERIRSTGLKQLLGYVETLVNESDIRVMMEDIQRMKEEYKSISEVYLEFGYYEGLKDIVINTDKSKKNNSVKESLISQLLKYGSAFLEDWDKTYCSIYYDARFSRLEEMIFEKLQTKKPAIFESLQTFYTKYSDNSFEDICELKVEAEFYIKFSELVCRMERLGLKFCKPEISNSPRGNTKIQGLFDLSLALQMIADGKSELSTNIVCNDLSFDDEGDIFIVTGPNKGGKTTYIRSVGIAQILFQAGCFVPALKAEMDIMDAVHTHFPEEETLGIDKGRLGEEAERVSVIINSSTPKSLVLLNETFSSTRSIDGYFLGRDVIKILMKIKCKGIYVTHFGELADDIDALNQEVQDGSRLAGLSADVEDTDGMGLTGKRTFRIKRMRPIGLGYSRDIVLKHGLSSEQITELLTKRGYIPG